MKTVINTPLFLIIWKWYHILIITIPTIILTWAYIFQRDVLLQVLTRYKTNYYVSIIIDILLSILIIYGVVKRKKVGYFASLIYLLKYVFRARNLGFDYFALGTIALFIVLVITFFLFKSGDHFGIKFTKWLKPFG